jgi:hydrogenase-4 component F
MPVTGVLWVVGLLAITGSPPFGAFVSEFAILKGIIDEGRYFSAVFYLAALSIVFVGMSAVVLPVVYGTPAKLGAAESEKIAFPAASPTSEPWWSVVPPLILAVAALALGVYLPQPMSDLLHQAAVAVGIE